MTEQVVKWDQGRQTTTEAHPTDRGYMRKIVLKDFCIYAAIYMAPPLAPVLNKFADYELGFTHKRWILVNTMLSAVALFVMTLPSFLPQPSFVTPFERQGAFFAFALRCLLTACVEAINVSHNPIEHLNLSKFPVYPVSGEEDRTAQDFYNSIMELSNFDPRPTWKNIFNSSLGLIAGLLISVGLVSISGVLRLYHHKSIFGNSFGDALCIVLSNCIIFGITFLLINVFFIGFSLYRSMRSSMRRLKNGTLGAHAAENARVEAESPRDIPETARARKKGRGTPTMKLDITNPHNLRAWMNVHEALNRRKDEVPARLLELGATMGLFFFFLMIILIAVESFSEDYSKMTSKEFLVNMTDLDMSGLYVSTYVVVVLGICMGALSAVGNSYNHSAKSMHIRHLYSIQLETTLDYHCQRTVHTPEEAAALKNSAELLESVQKHLRYHVSELGLLGLSYSRLFWGISGIVSSILTRQFFRMF